VSHNTSQFSQRSLANSSQLTKSSQVIKPFHPPGPQNYASKSARASMERDHQVTLNRKHIEHMKKRKMDDEVKRSELKFKKLKKNQE